MSQSTSGPVSPAIITKFEGRASRVKGLAFHPTLPWLLAAHHNGSLQIYDYRMGTVVDKYEEHQGPVRSCAFHPTQPLFVSGGDDGTVKVFNHRQRKLLFSLPGHLDYIRSVVFHHEAPWIASASDDQTIRIWNWQSRQCVAVLSGHNHYVMSAAFHPTDDLLVSGSLDQTIRVWDLSAIRAKHAPAPGAARHSAPGRGGKPAGSPEIDLFAGSGLETSVRFILEGHERGVNWVQFHATKPLILSGSDDRAVKIWRYNDVRAWEVETFRGHMNNVSAVLWHPRGDLVLSNAEDRTMRIWDCSAVTGASPSGGNPPPRSKCVLTVKRDNDRFWSLAVHPTLNLFAAGHDAGLVLFKLERERPAFCVADGPDGDVLYYVRDRLVRSFALDGTTESDEFVAPLEHPLRLPAAVTFSPTERALCFSPAAAGAPPGTVIQLRDKGHPLSLPNAASAIFVARNRLVALEATADGTAINVRAISDLAVVIRSIVLPVPGICRLLAAPAGTFLAVSPTHVLHVDSGSGRVLVTLEAVGVKYAVWSPDGEHLALLSKRAILLTDKTLLRIDHVHSDSVGVKSAVWDLSGPGPILYYTNAFHLKYLLPVSRDTGIICTTATPLYLVRVRGDLVHVLDRSGAVLVLAIDPSVCHFQLALATGDTARISHVVATSHLVGQAIIAHLREKGHAAIALQFVKDPASRFDLAIECANLEVACSAAKQLDTPAIWIRLGQEALEMGNVQVARLALTHARQPARLALLNLLTGGGDLDGASEHDSVLNADADSDCNLDMMRALWSRSSSALSSALLAHNLPVLAHLANPNGGVSLPPTAVLGDFLRRRAPVDQSRVTSQATGNWPLVFDPAISVDPVAAPGDIGGGWDDISDGAEIVGASSTGLDAFAGVDLDIPLDAEDLAALATTEARSATERLDLELPGELPASDASATTPLTMAALMDAVLADDELVHITPLMQRAMERIVVSSALFLPGRIALSPAIATLSASVSASLAAGLTATTQGRVAEALVHFRTQLQLHAIVRAFASSDDSAVSLALAREYIVGLLVETRRRDIGETHPALALHLAVLFTHCALQGEHHLLSLRAALALAYKTAAYRTAASLARRILALANPPAPEAVLLQARKVLSVAERANYSEAVDLTGFGSAGGDASLWRIDPVQMIVLDGTQTTLRSCVYCDTKYAPDTAISACVVCEIGRI